MSRFVKQSKIYVDSITNFLIIIYQLNSFVALSLTKLFSHLVTIANA